MAWGAAPPQLPVTGCRTENAAGSGIAVIPGYLPARAVAPGDLTVPQISKLAWYEGDLKTDGGFKTLAPRGWNCFALLGADGGWDMTVVPLGAKPDREVEVYGHYNGPGASLACDYFPSAYSDSPLPADCKAPSGATITLQSSHLVTVVTSPRGAFYFENARGTFVSTRTRLTGRSFLFWYPRLGNTAEGVQCVLPHSELALCSAILAEAQARLGHQLQKSATK